MSIIKIILVTIALVSVAIFGLAIRIVLLKDGKFPQTHVGRNKNMKKFGITCVQTYDKMEQKKAKKENLLKKMKLAK